MLSQNLKRYIPLSVWIVVVFTIIFIPLKIIGYAFLPMDDALRHAAKTISGKSWQQILVMRNDFPIDPSPGWQKILEWVHGGFGGNAELLVIFSIVALMLLVTVSALPWLRRPEAWLAALGIAAVFVPECTTRFARGRPFLLTDAVVITILLLWSRQENDRPRRAALIITPLLVAASAWIHGSWYLLCLPGAAILFAGRWRSAMVYGICWLAGSFLGCALPGHPLGFSVSIRAAHVRRVRRIHHRPPARTGVAAVRRRNSRRIGRRGVAVVAENFFRLEPARAAQSDFPDDGSRLAAGLEDAPVLVGFRNAGIYCLGGPGIAEAFRESSFN